ncbi:MULTISPECIES: hypothetical protein [unclassified Arthrobacter]|uniref:hypothetical protein n=1 Tax=unclassified Arthrobacter TaxID=235627 RepID=UPI0021F2235A|nr:MULTISPECIES: hypothetical protein [unclassified Arthrobacter]
MFAGPDIGARLAPGRLRGKVAIYNENLRSVADAQGAVLIDLWAEHSLREYHMWSSDRLHFSSAGHEFIASVVLTKLKIIDASARSGMDFGQASTPLGFREDLLWARQHLLPWALRRVQGKSSGTDREAKRPALTPLSQGQVWESSSGAPPVSST